MKLLILGNSNDTGSFVRPEEKRHLLLGQRLSEEFGEPVDVAALNCWPNDRMVAYVSREMEAQRPDLVYLNITTFPFAYESTPMRVKRVLGRVGGNAVGDAGMRVAGSRRWSHNVVFRTLRRLGKATVGGDTHFTPEETAERYAELIRSLVKHEDAVLVVKGPLGRGRPGITRRERTRHERRRQLVHSQIKAVCQQLHVPYHGSDDPYWVVRPKPKGITVGDGTHSNAAGHAFLADDHFPAVREAWAAHLEQVGEAASRALAGGDE